MIGNWRISVAPMWLLVALLLAFAAACGDDDDDDDNPADGGTGDDDTSPADDDDDDDDNDDNDDNNNNDDNDDNDASPGDYWLPNQVVPIGVHPDVRGFMVRRGIIHLHSVYSHDACDNKPFIDGEPNWKCLEQLREAFCTTNQQYIMLTDHADPFSYYEFPDVLLYTPDEGDELIYDEDENPIANRIVCPDGNELILAAGNENDVMPLALKRMPDGTPEERMALLGARDAAAVNTMHDLGAAVFVNHSEMWTNEELAALPIDGIELYNLHANIDPDLRRDYLGLPALGFVLPLLHFLFPYAESGAPDLVLLSFLSENGPAMEHFDYLLADRRMVGVLGTDAHRNALPFPLWDGDRTDSYRRMMRWFANYVLIDQHELANIEQAVAGGRIYGAFQAFGEPVGFDFHAATAKGAFEMGDEVSLADSPTLSVTRPTFYNLDPSWPAAEMHVRLIRADGEDSEVVAEETDADISFEVLEPGAYRAEIKIIPYHLVSVLGDSAAMFIHEYPFIYANPIYVTD